MHRLQTVEGFVERHHGQRFEHEVGVGEVEGGGHFAGHRNTAHTGAFGSQHAVGCVLDGEGMGGMHA